MDEIRIAVVGLGPRGLGWIRQLSAIEGFRVVAMCDNVPAMLDRAQGRLPEGLELKAYGHYEDVLAAPDVDAIGLTVRCKDQGAMAAQALEAGKHVSSEVPAAHSIEDCWRIVLAAERTDRVYLLAEQARYFGFVEAWRALVEEGKLGKVVYCEGEYIRYKGTGRYFFDPETGRRFSFDELPDHPEAVPNWFHLMPPLHYLVHNISPLLRILDDRIVEVTGMSTRAPSYLHPELGRPDFQVALAKTGKDTLLRLAVSWSIKTPAQNNQWYQMMGTKGLVRWSRYKDRRPTMWLDGWQMHEESEVDMRYERTDAPAVAAATGHHGGDYYPHAIFREAVLNGVEPKFDVYQAVETAAPAIMAAESVERGSELLKVPDFRPNESRPAGAPPKEV